MEPSPVFTHDVAVLAMLSSRALHWPPLTLSPLSPTTVARIACPLYTTPTNNTIQGYMLATPTTQLRPCCPLPTICKEGMIPHSLCIC